MDKKREDGPRTVSKTGRMVRWWVVVKDMYTSKGALAAGS
jgi:hypothetical protein